MKNGAQLLCDSLLSNGIDVCFANPGTSEMHFVAALDERPEMRCVLGLFEGVVTGAADGYARMSGKPAATLLHLGPGMANGLANMHNAKRAQSPMVNIVGDHALYHLRYDAPLTSDIESLAHPMSDWVRRILAPEDLAADIAAAIANSRRNQGQVSTLILPADMAWADMPSGTEPIHVGNQAQPVSVDMKKIRHAADVLRSGAKVDMILGGNALMGEALSLAGQIAQSYQVRLFSETSNKRIERGQGRTSVERFPYDVDAATKALQDCTNLILIGAQNPVAFFAYPDRSSIFLPASAACLQLVERHQDTLPILQALADELNIRAQAPIYQIPQSAAPSPQSGTLCSQTLTRVVTELLPENAIVCDESISQGREFYLHSHQSAPHDYLQLTGGAIGIGLPMATGAAIACPDRKVITLQADGSAMFTLQALWTQAREQLDCITIILSNRSYATLFGEMKRMGINHPSTNALNMFELQRPEIGWVDIAKGMGVPARRVETIQDFRDALKTSLASSGPVLIEAVID